MRYALFAGNTYYPWGGWQDYVDSYESVALAIEAKDTIDEYDRAWWHVVDLERHQVMESGGVFGADYQSRWDDGRKGLSP